MPNEVLKNVKAHVAADDGATWWLEELLFRGRAADKHGGELQGAHVVIGTRSKGPTGEYHTTITQPLPVGDGPADVPMMEVLEALHLSQQAAIETLTAKVVVLEDANRRLLAKLQEAMFARKARPVHAAGETTPGAVA